MRKLVLINDAELVVKRVDNDKFQVSLDGIELKSGEFIGPNGECILHVGDTLTILLPPSIVTKDVEGE